MLYPVQRYAHWICITCSYLDSICTNICDFCPLEVVDRGSETRLLRIKIYIGNVARKGFITVCFLVQFPSQDKLKLPIFFNYACVISKIIAYAISCWLNCIENLPCRECMFCHNVLDGFNNGLFYCTETKLNCFWEIYEIITFSGQFF